VPRLKVGVDEKHGERNMEERNMDMKRNMDMHCIIMIMLER
jgi:hypothetical protein